MTGNQNPKPETAAERGPVLSVQRLHKRYGAFSALRDISLEVSAGEFVCFLGPSGCGKTTLLRAIAGLDLQSEGAILHRGLDISREPPERRGFGIVFQSYALFPNLSVAANIAYGLVSQHVSAERCQARVSELLDLVGLPGFEIKFPGQCSGGQQQRVALARALAPAPALLLLDEPLSALDAQVRLQLRAQLKVLQQHLGITTIMVTHDQEEALSLADRVVVMNQGVIVQTGAPQEVYNRPASAFVAGFVGAMNFFPARLEAPDRLHLGGQSFALNRPAPFAPGAAVRAGIRPEHLRLEPERTWNTLPCEVTAAEFLGAHSRLSLKLDDGAQVQALFAPERAQELRPGKRLALGLPAEHLMAFAA